MKKLTKQDLLIIKKTVNNSQIRNLKLNSVPSKRNIEQYEFITGEVLMIDDLINAKVFMPQTWDIYGINLLNQSEFNLNLIPEIKPDNQLNLF